VANNSNKPGPKKGAKVAKQSSSSTTRRKKVGGGHGPVEHVMVIGFADRAGQEPVATGPYRGRVTWVSRPRDTKR